MTTVQLTTAQHPSTLGIAEVAEASGLSADTLRWYEREGLLPPVPRGTDGRRQYRPADRDMVRLLVALRTAGMSTADMKEFVQLIAEGAASHGRRIALLERTRAHLAERRRALDEAERALDVKVAHYRSLIDAGLDCDGSAVPAALRSRQAARTTPAISTATATSRKDLP